MEELRREICIRANNELMGDDEFFRVHKAYIAGFDRIKNKTTLLESHRGLYGFRYEDRGEKK